MKIKSLKEYKAITKPTHNSNLQTMELLRTTEWFPELVEKARKIAGWPINGFKINDPTLLKKIDGGGTIFLPEYTLQQNYTTKKEFNKIIDAILEKSGIGEHFMFYIRGYILYNIVIAPATNFTICNDIDLENKKKKFPYICTYSKQCSQDKKLADHELEANIKATNYPILQKKFFKSKKSLLKDIEIEKKAQKIKSKKYIDLSGAYDNKVPDYTDKDAATEIFKVSSERAALLKTNQIRKKRERLRKALRERKIPMT